MQSFDLKCENLLLDRNFKVKLADFGFAPFQHSNELLQTYYCGSLPYKAPEVILEKLYSGKASDAWSSGIVLNVMLTGVFPFDITNPRVMINISNKGDKFPSFVKDACRKLITSILNVDPRERYSKEEILRHHWMRSTQKEVETGMITTA